DVVLGDHGSTTQYAAAIGRRIALVPSTNVREGSPADELARRATVLDVSRPLLPQLETATGGHEVITEAITSRPGSAATVLRLAIHRILGLDVPEREVVVEPVPLPLPLDAPLGSGWKPMSPNDFRQTARSTPVGVTPALNPVQVGAHSPTVKEP
ncbi:MAG TPA: hypothetical protein VNO31_38655, partial [Umezawaea sp.]|nr:hypothetical protein [Umezawaea sp.]